MLDCESKKYRVRSNGFGGYTITDKRTNETRTVWDGVPSASYLAAIHEREFDKEIGKLFEEAR